MPITASVVFYWFTVLALYAVCASDDDASMATTPSISFGGWSFVSAITTTMVQPQGQAATVISVPGSRRPLCDEGDSDITGCSFVAAATCETSRSNNPEDADIEIGISGLPRSKATMKVYLHWFSTRLSLSRYDFLKTANGMSVYSFRDAYAKYGEVGFNGGHVGVDEKGHAIIQIRTPSGFPSSNSTFSLPLIYLHFCRGANGFEGGLNAIYFDGGRAEILSGSGSTLSIHVDSFRHLAPQGLPHPSEPKPIGVITISDEDTRPLAPSPTFHSLTRVPTYTTTSASTPSTTHETTFATYGAFLAPRNSTNKIFSMQQREEMPFKFSVISYVTHLPMFSGVMTTTKITTTTSTTAIMTTYTMLSSSLLPLASIERSSTQAPTAGQTTKDQAELALLAAEGMSDSRDGPLKFSLVYQCLSENRLYDHLSNTCGDACPDESVVSYSQCVRQESYPSALNLSAGWKVEMICNNLRHCWRKGTHATAHSLRLSVAGRLGIPFQEVTEASILFDEVPASERLSDSDDLPFMSTSWGSVSPPSLSGSSSPSEAEVVAPRRMVCLLVNVSTRRLPKDLAVRSLSYYATEPVHVFDILTLDALRSDEVELTFIHGSLSVEIKAGFSPPMIEGVDTKESDSISPFAYCLMRVSIVASTIGAFFAIIVGFRCCHDIEINGSSRNISSVEFASSQGFIPQDLRSEVHIFGRGNSNGRTSSPFVSLGRTQRFHPGVSNDGSQDVSPLIMDGVAEQYRSDVPPTRSEQSDSESNLSLQSDGSDRLEFVSEVDDVDDELGFWIGAVIGDEIPHNPAIALEHEEQEAEAFEDELLAHASTCTGGSTPEGYSSDKGSDGEGHGWDIVSDEFFQFFERAYYVQHGIDLGRAGMFDSPRGPPQDKTSG